MVTSSNQDDLNARLAQDVRNKPCQKLIYKVPLNESVHFGTEVFLMNIIGKIQQTMKISGELSQIRQKNQSTIVVMNNYHFLFIYCRYQPN